MTNVEAIQSTWTSKQRLLDLYPLAVQRVDPMSEHIALVVTENESLEARLVDESAARLRRAVLDYAAKRRFRLTQRFIRTLHGDAYVPAGDGYVLYLTHAYEGPGLDVSPMAFQVAAMNLALLHHAIGDYASSADFDGLSPPQPTTNWLTICERQTAEYTSEPSQFMELDPEEGTSLQRSIVSLASQVNEILHRSDYIGLWNSAVSLKRVSWNDYGLHVLRPIGSKGQIATLQPVDPVADHPIRDLGWLTAEALAHLGETQAIQVIKQYESLHPLSTAARTSVAAFAAFPNLTLWQRTGAHPPLSDANGEPNGERRFARCLEAARALLSATTSP